MTNFVTCTLHKILLGWSKSQEMGWTAYGTCMGELRSAYEILVRKSYGKSPLGRPNIKKVLRDTVCGDVDWFELTQDRVQ
jgi:hypothetical protein